MPALTPQQIFDCKPCHEFRSLAKLQAIWGAKSALTAKEMLARDDQTLSDRLWCMMKAEPEIDWRAVSKKLHALIDPKRYSQGETSRYGCWPYVAAGHLALYCKEIGDESPLKAAVEILEEALKKEA